MKRIDRVIFTIALTCLFNSAFAQNINWKNLKPTEKHIVNLNVGFDNASVIGIGYGYHFNTKMPLVLNLEYSMPFGEKSLDDFKTKIGAQLNIVKTNHFFTTIKAAGIFRRFENDFSRMLNFGSEFAATAGYYRNKWFAAGEFGFDKAIITHFKHSTLMKSYNPGLQTGWYLPTGGNFLFGLQTGYSFKRNDLYAKAGKTISQDLKTTATVPLYFQLGWNRKW
jgi:hypothetical protein